MKLSEREKRIYLLKTDVEHRSLTKEERYTQNMSGKNLETYLDLVGDGKTINEIKEAVPPLDRDWETSVLSK